jgi:secreted PhoX family phosphatase
LTSEEYEPLAVKDGWTKNVESMTKYLGSQANPYDYGWMVELIPDKSGENINTQVVKHYAMGRLSNEMALVMPDSKTVYRGDDGTGTVLFKFVADTAGDLSAGTLYAAKVTQQPDDSFQINWLKLGAGNDADIADAIAAFKLPAS